MKKYVFTSFDASKTLQLGSALASGCVKSCIIFLNGQIGVGKTVFCKGFLHHLGYIGIVKSPTYTLMESYFLNHWHVHHFDFYRLKFSEEIEHVGVYECLYGNFVCLIEWPMSDIRNFFQEDILVTINYFRSNMFRKIIIETFSDLGDKMLVSLLRYIGHANSNQK